MEKREKEFLKIAIGYFFAFGSDLVLIIIGVSFAIAFTDNTLMNK